MGYRDRKDKIMDLLNIEEEISYQQLTESLGVSEATVRRDLANMEKEELLVRYWGGAKRNAKFPVRTRNILEGVITEELRIIGEIAGNIVEDGELIFIGAGLTTLTMIDYIEATKLTVITNGIPQLEALKRKGITAFLLCGFLKNYSRALVGPQTLEMLSGYNFDKVFVGANGVGDDLCILSADGYEYDIKKIVINNSKESYVLAGHGKFHRSAMYLLHPEEIKNTFLVTDQKMDEHKDWVSVKRGFIRKIN